MGLVRLRAGWREIPAFAGMTFVLLLLSLPVRAEPAIEPGDLRLWVEVEEREGSPFAGEMLLLRIRGAYKIPISLENLVQPDLEGFGWMQLGPDRWFHERERGQKVLNLERIMAVFPERAGTLTVASFVHALTLSERDGTRFEHRLTSEPVEIEVLPAPEPPATWLPIRKIEVEDRWSNAPERLAADASALRMVTLTVHGVQPETMPPMPEMTGAGAVILPHPPKVITALQPTGPVTRVFWRWSIRPERGLSGYVDPLTFRYYDAAAQEARSITLAAQRVAYAGADLPVGARATDARADAGTDGVRLSGIAGAVTPFAPLLGLIGGLAVLLRRSRVASRGEMRRAWCRVVGTPEERAFRSAVRGGEAARARLAARRLVTADLAEGRYGDDEAYAPVFAGLDRGLYGGGATGPVAEFASAFGRVRRKLTNG